MDFKELSELLALALVFEIDVAAAQAAGGLALRRDGHCTPCLSNRCSPPGLVPFHAPVCAILQTHPEHLFPLTPTRDPSAS